MYTGYMTPLETAIVCWRMENPMMDAALNAVLAVIALALIAYVLSAMRRERLADEKRHREERARRRAWIKANGGL